MKIFNISATKPWQGYSVPLERSDMGRALNTAKMPKTDFARTSMEEMKHLIMKPRAEVQEDKNWGFEFPAYTNVTAAIERNPAMVHGNHTSSCLPFENHMARIH